MSWSAAFTGGAAGERAGGAVWLGGGWARTRDGQREGRGFGWRGSGEEGLWRSEGEGRQGQGPEGGRGQWRLGVGG